MADYDANATPNMNFFNRKLVSLPYARPKIKIDCMHWGKITNQLTLLNFCSVENQQVLCSFAR